MSKGMKMCVNCKYLKDGKYCNRKKSDIYNPKIFCGYWKQKPTVFDTITASPEVLAPKLVYCNVTVKTIPSISREQPGGVELTKGWYSTIIHGKVWSNESEAIAATVARLKEVCDE